MSREAKPLLAASLGALIGAVVAFGIVAGRRERALVDDGAERQAVEEAAHQVLPENAEGAADPRLRQAVERLAAAQGVARLWLVDADGRIALGFRGPGRAGEAVAELAPADDRATIDSLRPPLPAADRLALLAAAAIRRDGDHNDVFKPLTLPVPGEDGRTRAVVALCYDIGSKAGPTPATVLPIATGLLLYWLGLAAWVLFDARVRHESPWLWGLLVLVTNLAGALAYVIATRREAAGPSPGGPHQDLLAGLAILLLLLGPMVGAEAMVGGALVALVLAVLLVVRSKKRGQTPVP
jgi:hypothetical protein